MNTKNILLLCFSLCAAMSSRADEKVTMLAKSSPGQVGYSETITLNQGDSAEALFATGSSTATVVISVAGEEFTTGMGGSNGSPRVTVAGPATLKVRVGFLEATQANSAIVTFNIHRAGTASAPVPIPQEAGTTWQVILEASSDLVNWTTVSPGDFPSSTPRRYFRTRLVKR